MTDALDGRALEEGLQPLEELCRDVPLPGDQPFCRLWALLALSVELAALESARTCFSAVENLETRQALSLVSRCVSRQAASLVASLSLNGPAEERALDRAFLSLEAAAALAQPMEPGKVRQALEFSLPERLDALYRAANLLALRDGTPADRLIGAYAEIMPGRPLAACHRHPFDGIGNAPEGMTLWEEMALLLVGAMEEESRRFLLHAAQETGDALARGFFLENSLLCDQRSVQAASLLPRREPLRRLLDHCFAAAYVYHSFPGEADRFAAEEGYALSQMRFIRQLIQKQGGNAPDARTYPPPLQWGQHKGYVRDALDSVNMTALGDGYALVNQLPRDADYFRYQRRVCPDRGKVPSSRVVEETIRKRGVDFRFEIAPHPVKALRDRTRDHY